MIDLNKGKTKVPKQTLFIIVLCMITLIAVLISISYIIRFHNIPVLSSEKVYDSEQLDAVKDAADKEFKENLKNSLTSGKSVSSILRDYFPDQVIYTDNNKYVFADINAALKKNTYNLQNFKKDDKGVITYSDQNIQTTHKGIDLSKYQGDVDFAKVKQENIEYAIIRCGYRSYGTGVLTQDSSFPTYITNALSNQIEAGVYFFSQAITVDEAVEEADFVLDQIRPYNVTYPVVIDVEEIFNDTFRQQDLSKDELTDVVIAFCERIKQAGYTPMIYGNLKYYIGKLDLTRLESYEKWFAYYDDTPYFPYEFSMWQYTEKGSINGINEDVDLNISFKDLSKQK